MKSVMLCLSLMAPVGAMAQVNPTVEESDTVVKPKFNPFNCKFTRAGCAWQTDSKIIQKGIDQFLYESLPEIEHNLYNHGIAFLDQSAQPTQFILLTCDGTPSRVVKPITCSYSKSLTPNGHQVIETPLELLSLLKPVIVQ